MLDALLRQMLHLMEPIGFTWFCLLVATAVLIGRKQRGLAFAAALLALFYTVIGSTAVPGRLLGALERPYAGVALDTLPTADALILLGGGASPSRFEAGSVHLTIAGDRLVMTHAVFQMGKAPILVLGGTANKLDGVIRFESEIVRDLLVTWGIPQQAMIPLPANGDTHDEALKVQALAAERGWRRILLVTSANHMRRAAATFRAQGLEVIPVPCNFLTTVSTTPPPLGIGVPRYDGFLKMSVWFHEQAGWLMYRRRGWIKE